MLLKTIAGFADSDAEPNSEEQVESLRSVLSELAEAFLRSGGHVTLSEWAELDMDEQVALMAAGVRVRIREAARLARGIREGHHRILAELLDKEQIDREVLDKAAVLIAQQVAAGAR